MKLMRLGPKGAVRPAMLDAQGVVRDLSGYLADITAHTLSPAGLDKLRRIKPETLPEMPAAVAAVPWSGMGKFIAIGLNYADHAAESNMPIPKEPVVFMKATSCAVGPYHPVVLPQGSV
jgi:2,4-diketo-3-deoxy-L-fuconate hydrolase